MTMQSRVVGKDTLTAKITQLGEWLFFMFVYGCILAKRGPTNAPTPDLDKMERLFNEGKPIPHSLFEKCFPVALSKLRAFIRDPLSEEPWPPEMVRLFCRLHKGKLPACDSKMDLVQSVNGIYVAVTRSSRTVTLVNHFGLRVGRLDCVYSHKGVIYDVEYPEPS